MKENREQVPIDGQVAMLALKYLCQFVDPRTYSDLAKQVERHKGFGEGTAWDASRYNRSYEDTERLVGKEVQSKALYDLLSQATNSGLVSSMSTTFKRDLKKSRSLLGLHSSALDVLNGTRLATFPSGKPAMRLVEGGAVKMYKKLKTVYGHLLTEDGLQQPQEVTCVCFDKSGRYVYTGSDDGLIKCWYALTGQLLDSLRCFHAITDLAVSPDNAYLAGGTLMGELRVWNREKLSKICTLSLSSSSINHIKWCCLGGDLYILACTDETIFVYSLNDIHEKADLAPYVCLGTPAECVALGVNKQGFLAAGLSSGKVLFWKLAKDKDKPLTERFLFDLQENQKKTYLIEWSPTDPLVISGSLDGKMVITRVSGLSYERKLVVDLREKYVSRTGVCNAVGWSVNGRYAIGALTGKPKASPKKRVTVLVVWDSSEEVFWTIPRGDNGIELAGNLLGLSVHPTMENIVACGGSNGFVYVVNIETCEILQTFRETGVWSHASEMDADILECVFSPTGLQFAISTAVGTLSFYGALPAENFQACPVEQFFKSDYMPDDAVTDPSKKVCNARLVEHTYQPPLPGAPDTNFESRLGYYQRQLETYHQLEAEVLKELPNANEERKVMIRDEERDEPMPEVQSDSDERDADYVAGESEEEPPGESENEDYLSGGSDDDDLLREARRGRRRHGRRPQRVSDNEAGEEEEEYKEEDEEMEEESEWHESQVSDDEDEGGKKRRRKKRPSPAPMVQEEEEQKAGEEVEEEKIPIVVDAEYHLDGAADCTPPPNAACAFCDKSEGAETFTGPYVLLRDEDHKKLSEEKLWIHQGCLEYNDFVYHSTGASSPNEDPLEYGGIKEALEKAAVTQPCSRCELKGSTIKCSSCYKWFHGYTCCNKSGVFLEDSRGKSSFKFRCYDCYGDYVVHLADDSVAKKANAQKLRSKLSREWVAGEIPVETGKGYVPQLNDECYYFFQGHEEFLREYFSYFCKMDPEEYPKMPWKRYRRLLTPTLCHVVNIAYEFPDPAIVYAIKAEFQLNYPPVLARLDLLIDGTTDSFQVLYLYQSPDQTPEFLIPKSLYESSKSAFLSQWRRKNSSEPFLVKTLAGTTLQISSIEDYEPSTFPNTDWKSLVGEELFDSAEKSTRLLRDKSGPSKNVRVSFWEVSTSNTSSDDPERTMINADIGTVIQNLVENDEDQYGIFIDDPSGIKDYLNVVPCPMYYDLICGRLKNGYYRRVEALVHDVRQVTENAKTFNAEAAPDIVAQAEAGVQRILQKVWRYVTEKKIEVASGTFDGVEMEEPKVEEQKKEQHGNGIEVVDGVSIIIPKELIDEKQHPEEKEEENEKEEVKEDAGQSQEKDRENPSPKEPDTLLVKIPRKIVKKQKEKAKKRQRRYEDDSDESYREPGDHRPGGRKRESSEDD